MNDKRAERNRSIYALGRKEQSHKIKGKKAEYTIIDEKVSCMLVDKYQTCIPWTWDVPEIEEITLF